MTALVRGWCPTLARPMRSGDGWLVRVRPPRGVLDAAGARALARVAERFGNGAIQLTGAAAIQVRGLRDETLAPFADAMGAAGLDAPGPAILWPPLHGDDPAVDPSAARIAGALSALALPGGKFRVAVDGGGVLPLDGAGADIVVRCVDGVATLHLAGADGCADLATTDVPAAVLRLADAVTGRMRDRVAAEGARAVFARAGLVPRPYRVSPMPRALGWLPYASGEGGAFGLGLPFGATDAATLFALADALDGCTLRLTPWRALVVVGAAALRVGARVGGMVVVDPDDARARVFACPGAPACAQASVPARADAARIAARGPLGTVHVSGCAKGCAHPRPAALTLVGRDGRYDVVREGRAGDAPVRRSLTLAEALA